jgi:hypothetical protein
MSKKMVKLLIFIIIGSMVLTTNISADTIWYDNFDDNKADEWKTEIIDWYLDDPFTRRAANFDTSTGTLKTPGETPGNIWYLATYESNIDIGTWMFDINILDTPWGDFFVLLMGDNWADFPTKSYGYDLEFSTKDGYPEPDSKGAIVLRKLNGWFEAWYTIGEWSTTEEIVGEHHVIVTRDTAGIFDVYLNDELIMHVDEPRPEFDMFSTFRFFAPSGPSIDNIVVLDTYDIETARDWAELETTPEPTPVPTPKSQVGIIGFPVESLSIGLVITILVLWFRQRTN